MITDAAEFISVALQLDDIADACLGKAMKSSKDAASGEYQGDGRRHESDQRRRFSSLRGLVVPDLIDCQAEIGEDVLERDTLGFFLNQDQA